MKPSRPERLPADLDRWSPALFNEALAARALLERARGPETAYQGIVLKDDDRPPSRGQCGVSSLWLAHHLLAKGVDAHFTEGQIVYGNSSQELVWVTVRHPNLSTAGTVIDITSDQYQSSYVSRVYVGEADGRPHAALYEAERDFHPHAISHRKLLARYVILQANLNTPQRWPWV